MGKSYTNGDVVWDKSSALGGDKVKSFGMKARGAFDDIKGWFDAIVNDDNTLKTSQIPAAGSTAAGISKLYTELGTNTDGAITQAAAKTAIDAKEETANKNVAGGYAGLDSDGRIAYVYNSNRVKRICDHQNPYLVANPPADWKMETTFASEISGYADTAAWLKARCAANDFTDMLPGDYFEHAFASESAARKSRMLGAETYQNCGDTAIPAHIDFCSGPYYGSAGFKWNDTNVNNGTASEPSPYRASKLFSEYADTILPLFPTWLSGKMTEKRALLPTRYSAAGTLTDDTSWAWNSMGKVWAFFEEEVAGQVYFQTKGFTGFFKQYPIFKVQPSWPAVFGRNTFWGAGASSGNSTHACNFGDGGSCGCDYASNAFCASLGFRISA